MSRANESETQQALEAVRQRGGLWGLWAYDPETDRLVLYSEGQPRGRWRRDPDAFLVCRSPRYVRLEGRVDGFELMTGAEAVAVMRYPPPASVLTENSNVLLARSDERELCVVCESAGYHIAMGDHCLGGRVVRAPLTVRRATVLPRNRFYRPIDQTAYFGEIQGATLQWQGRGVSHAILILAAIGLLGEPFALYFGYVQSVDCPTTMHNVRLRMATTEEREALRASSALAASFDDEFWSEINVAFAPREGLLAVECDEGVFSIWAGVLFLSWRDAVEFEVRIPDPLWRGGPRLAEL